jgi:hypothetical protein
MKMSPTTRLQNPSLSTGKKRELSKYNYKTSLAKSLVDRVFRSFEDWGLGDPVENECRPGTTPNSKRVVDSS